MSSARPHSKTARRFAVALMAILVLMPLAFGQVAETTLENVSASPSKSVKKPKTDTQARSSEAKAIGDFVEKHRQKKEQGAVARKAQLTTLLETPPPENSAARKQWRDNIRAVLAAERKAAEQADKALRAEIEAHERALRPDSEEEPGT